MTQAVLGASKLERNVEAQKGIINSLLTLKCSLLSDKRSKEPKEMSLKAGRPQREGISPLIYNSVQSQFQFDCGINERKVKFNYIFTETGSPHLLCGCHIKAEGEEGLDHSGGEARATPTLRRAADLELTPSLGQQLLTALENWRCPLQTVESQWENYNETFLVSPCPLQEGSRL